MWVISMVPSRVERQTGFWNGWMMCNKHSLKGCWCTCQIACLCHNMTMSKHLRTQRRLNPHTLFLYFWSWKTISDPSPSTSYIAKIAQFNKRMGKISNVWCKGVQCSMMVELKQITISSTKFLCISEAKKFVNPWLVHKSGFKSLKVS